MKDPTRADQLARSLDTQPLNSSHHSPTTLGAEITSDARVELDELRNAALTILGLIDRLMCSPAARDAVLLHEQEFAQELIQQARAYRSRSHIWSQRARAALLSKELSKLGVTASTPRDTAIEMLDQFCHRHGLLDSPDLDAKSRARTLARAQKALSGGKPSNRGPRKGQQRALLVLLNQEGLGEKNIAKTESLSPFEIGRLLSRSNIEQVDSVTTVAAAESRVIEVARYIVLGSAIDNGIDVQPLLDDSRGPIDIELGLRLRARRQAPK